MNSILVARQEGNSAHKTTVPNVPKGSLPEDVNRGIARKFLSKGPKYITYFVPQLKHKTTATGSTHYLRRYLIRLVN